MEACTIMWDVDLVLMLRVLLNDLNSPQKNSDIYLQRVLVAAGIFVDNEIELTNDYIFDIANITITPDPVSLQDISVQALLPLKAACMINQGQFQTAVSQGIMVRDGDSMINTSVGFKGYADILKYGPCSAYEKLKYQLQASSSALVGGAVMGAHRGPNDSPIDTVSWFYNQISVSSSGRDRNRH